MIHAPQEKILVISQTMPRPDMHSGSLRLFTMLEIMAKKWQVVLVISFGSNPGDEPYISRLERHGIRVYRKLPSLNKLMQSETFRLALLEFWNTAEYYLERIRIQQPQCRVVVDSVDVHFLRLKLKYELTRAEADLTLWQSTLERELACMLRLTPSSR